MADPTVLVDAFDYPSSLPSSGAGTDYPFAAEDITTTDGGDILDANVQMCYRTRQYELEPVVTVTGSAHRHTEIDPDNYTDETWTWAITIDNNPTLIARLEDNTTPTTEEDFITFADRATTGRKGWMYKGIVDEDPMPLIGEIAWEYESQTVTDGVPDTPVTDSSSEGVRLDSFRVEWAIGDSGSVSAPVMVGNDFQGAFFAVFNISIGVPTGFASAWLNTPSSIQGGRPDSYTTASNIDMVMTRKTLSMPIEWTSNITPNTDVVFDTDTQSISFIATPILDFSWTP